MADRRRSTDWAAAKAANSERRGDLVGALIQTAYASAPCRWPGCRRSCPSHAGRAT